MMKIIWIVLFLLPVYLAEASCADIPVPPKDKKEKTISRHAVDRFARHRMKISGYTQLFFDTLALDTVTRIPFKPHLSNSFPKFRVFDCRTQMEVAGWAAGEGPACVYHIYDTFPPRNIHPLLPGCTLSDCIPYLHNRDYSIHQPKTQGYDYVIYAWWLTSLKSPSAMMARELKRYVKKHKDKRIQLVFVNVDRIRN